MYTSLPVKLSIIYILARNYLLCVGTILKKITFIAISPLDRCCFITYLAIKEWCFPLLQACRAKGVDCIVAPYEADAQLAYLNKIGIADVIITEDSDLVLFGCDKVRVRCRYVYLTVMHS